MEMGDLFLGLFARCCSIKHVLPSFIDGTDSGFDDSVDSVCSRQDERPGLADCWMLRKLGMSNIPLLHSLCILFYSYCATLAQLSPSYLGDLDSHTLRQRRKDCWMARARPGAARIASRDKYEDVLGRDSFSSSSATIK